MFRDQSDQGFIKLLSRSMKSIIVKRSKNKKRGLNQNGEKYGGYSEKIKIL